MDKKTKKVLFCGLREKRSLFHRSNHVNPRLTQERTLHFHILLSPNLYFKRSPPKILAFSSNCLLDYNRFYCLINF